MKAFKKLITGLGIALAVLSAQAQNWGSRSFLSDGVLYQQVTNAACASCYSNTWAGITVTNGAAAPLGGYTNIKSFSYGGTVVGTNCPTLTWTNSSGIWVIPTNGVPGTVSGILFKQGPDSTELTKDLPLWIDREGRVPTVVLTNNWLGDANAYNISPIAIQARIFGAASAATKIDLIFIGCNEDTLFSATSSAVPSGTPPVDGASTVTTTQAPCFQWGIVPAAGTIVISTNLPVWKFAGYKYIRLRSASLATTTAANIAVTIQDLRLVGAQP